MRRVHVAVLALASVFAPACGHALHDGGSATSPDVAKLRERGEQSRDGETVGRWALAEMVEPGGDAKRAADARRRLGEIPHDGLYASLARGIADEAHGEPRTAAEAYVATLRAAATSEDPDTHLIAWVAVHNLIALRGSVADLYEKNRATLDGLQASPGNIGWRALGDLEEWWATVVSDRAEETGEAYDALVAKRLGCSPSVRLAGPFGHGSSEDRNRTFDAERPGPWPSSWAPDPLRGTLPHVLDVERHRCLVASTESTAEGILYAETYFDAPSERELIVAVQGAVKVWVDDHPVLNRDPGEWGTGSASGRSSTCSRAGTECSRACRGSCRAFDSLNRDGSPADVTTDGDASIPYTLDAPVVGDDPNPIHDLVEGHRQDAPPLRRFLGAYAAHAEGLDDVASVLMEPLATVPHPAALSLSQAAEYALRDPALPDDVRTRTSKAFREAAVTRDPKLWDSRMRLALDDAEQRGVAEAVEPLKALVREFRDEPEILEQLARVYGRLGWRAEHLAALSELAKSFPDDVAALRLYLDAVEEDGALGDADALAARIKRLDPDSEVDLDRALARQDWAAAIAELKRLGARRPDRKEITRRIADVLARAGDPRAAAAQLGKALARHPDDSAARFRLADAAYAKGDTEALRRALAESLEVGADGNDLRAAIDLLEGATDLEPYRIDGRATIREFEAWEKAGNHMDGTAARVLDYGATWVHPDGSSEMLEHEIQRIQSQEAINSEANIDPPSGLVLHLRVIKPDGTTLEPEPIPGKPTLTFPHLEVGDYIELEHVSPVPGDGMKGRHFKGPHWFFREPDKGYWRSEFVVVTPKDKEKILEVEINGKVGPDSPRDLGMFIEHRWRVDLSPPAPNEPDAPPQTEFLPSVRVGWGVTLDDTLARLVDLAADDTPKDPRLKRLALEIVRGSKDADTDERARLAYRYVVDKVQDGKETDGRRVLMGRAGSPQAAFRYLLRLLDIPDELAIVKNGLATPPLGEMSKTEEFDGLLMRLTTNGGVRWLQLRDKFAPFAYVPADYRGQPAFRLIAGTPPDTVSATGSLDAILYEGRADVRDDGSAHVDLSITFSGNRGIYWRSGFSEIPEARRFEFIEKMVVARTFDGGHLREMHVENLTSLDAPLILRLKIEAPQLAKQVGLNLSIGAIFHQGLNDLATLPSRQTPILRRQSWHTGVHFEVAFRETMRMPATVPTGDVKFEGCRVSVKDAVHGHALYLDRLIDLPAGRVQPGDDYAGYQKFSQEADALFERETLIGR